MHHYFFHHVTLWHFLPHKSVVSVTSGCCCHGNNWTINNFKYFIKIFTKIRRHNITANLENSKQKKSSKVFHFLSVWLPVVSSAQIIEGPGGPVRSGFQLRVRKIFVSLCLHYITVMDMITCPNVPCPWTLSTTESWGLSPAPGRRSFFVSNRK